MPDQHHSTFTGRCLCGAVQFELSNPPVRSLMCHCASCRRATGGLHVLWAVVNLVDLQWLTLAPHLFNSSSHVQRGFCATCGTSLTYQNANEPETIDITVASFDHPENFPPQADIWTSDRLIWEKDHDSRPQCLQDIESNTPSQPHKDSLT